MASIPPISKPTVSHGKIVAVVLIYTAFAAAWILLSDRVLKVLFSEPGQIIQISMFKGWFYVGMTSLLLYGLLRRWFYDTGNKQQPEPDGQLKIPLLILASTIMLFMLIGVMQSFKQHGDEVVTRLQGVVNLETRRIADLLKQRRGDAEFLRASVFLAERYRQWRERGDQAGGEVLKSRLRQLVHSWGLVGVNLLDARGLPVWSSEDAPAQLPEEVLQSVGWTMADAKIRLANPYRDTANRVLLDVLVPLAALGDPLPVPLIVLHIDLAHWLYPNLDTLPILSNSGETLLMRGDSEQPMYLNPLRHAPPSVLEANLPRQASKSIATQVLRKQAELGKRMEGFDYRNIPVLSVANSVEGTDWYLVAKLDQTEVYAQAMDDALWVGLVGVLALFVAGAGYYLLLQMQQLNIARAVQETQAERLRALNLLAAIADSSGDMIYAKDLQGCYVLFNRAAGVITGKAPAQVLGQDDSMLFPKEQADRLMAIEKQVISRERTISDEETLTTAGGERIFHATKGPLYDGRGRVMGMFGISRDITTRKFIIAALSRQHEELTSRNQELERFNHAMVGRELEMIKLKSLLNELARAQGKQSPYNLIFPDDRSPPNAEEVAVDIRESLSPGHGITPDLLKILIIESGPADYLLLEQYLHRRNLNAICRQIAGNSELDEALSSEWDVVLSDFNVPGMAFRQTLQRIRARYPDLPVILVSDNVGEETAIDLLRLGMSDFVLKSNLLRLLPAIQNALTETRERRAFKDAEAALKAAQSHVLEEQRKARLAALNLMEDAVAARVRAEDANTTLRETEQRLLLAQEGAHVGIWEWDVNSKQAYWSPEYEKLFGVAPGTLKTAEDWRARILLEDLPLIEAEWEANIRHGKTFDVEFRIRRPDGEIRWMFSKGSAFLDPAGQAVRLCGINIDITDRKQVTAELEKHRHHLEELVENRTRELRRQTHALQALIDNLPHMAWMKDSEGRFVAVNRIFAASVDHRMENLLGKTDWDIRPRAVAERYREEDRQVIAKRQPMTIEESGILIPDSLYEVFKAPIFDADGSVLGTVAFARDIKPQREMEDELARRAEAAEIATRAKTAFLANMSHEIRTPMNAIIGLTYLLRQTPLSQDQRERLSRIDSAAQHLLSIINDILDLSKIEAGRMELDIRNFSLNELLNPMRSILGNQAASKGLTIEVETQNMPQWLKGDPTRLRQALLNYVGNAVKFSEQGVIYLRCCMLEENKDGLIVRFEVQDSGIGIAEQHMAGLYEVFAQTDISTTRQYGGTGLGLTITKRIANLMGGEVGAESVLGQGSTFWFTARLQRGQAGLPNLVQTGTETLLRQLYTGAKVLLAEDNAINQEVALDMLRSVGLEVDVAENGRAVLEKIAKKHYDLVLMDIQMPELDGLETTKALRAQSIHAELPVLAMTANAFEEDRQRCLDAGMNDFIPKPVMPEPLYAKLLHWLPKDYASLSVGPGQAKTAHSDAPAAGMGFDAIAGLDAKHLLQMAMGDTGKSRRLLSMFVNSHAEAMTQVLELLAENRIEQAKQLTHALKGVAAVLGATQVLQAAKDLDQALRQQVGVEQCIELAGICDAEVRQLVAAIKALNETSSEKLDTQSGGSPNAEPVLEELKKLLRENNARAGTLAEQSKDVLQLLLGEHHAEFVRQIHTLDYQAALSLLNKGRGTGF